MPAIPGADLMHIRYDGGDGPTVVLLHGQPGSASDWVRVVPRLRAHPVRVVAVDRPGYGASRQQATGWRGNAEALLSTLTAAGIASATLVGWSWAGGVALEAALLAPERVDGLVLIGSVGHQTAVGPADQVLAAPGIRALMAPFMNRLGKRGTGLLTVTSGSTLDAEALEFFAAEAGVWPATGAWQSAATEQVAMVRDAQGLSRRLPTVSTPTAVIHGWRDQYVTVKAGAALAAAIPHARLLPVEGGHLLPFEHPDLLAAHIAAAVLHTDPASAAD